MGATALVDEDWHAGCQAVDKGVKGAERETLYYKCVEMRMEVDVRNPSGSSRAMTLWKVMDARERGGTCDDQSYTTNIECKEAVRQGLWNAHLQSPPCAVSEALRSVETWEDAAGGSRS